MPQGKRTVYSDVTIGTTGIISAEHLQRDPEINASAGSESGMTLFEALSCLAPGGYLIDLRPLDEHPRIVSWVVFAPFSNGHIEGTEIECLPELMQMGARELLVEGDRAQGLASLVSKMSEPIKGPFCPIDHVSSEYLAIYWHSRGARVGRRKRDCIRWLDGTQQSINTVQF